MPKLRRSRSRRGQGDQGVQRLDQHFNPPEINQPIPEIRQHLMIEYHLGKVCLVHRL